MCCELLGGTSQPCCWKCIHHWGTMGEMAHYLFRHTLLVDEPVPVVDTCKGQPVTCLKGLPTDSDTPKWGNSTVCLCESYSLLICQLPTQESHMVWHICWLQVVLLVTNLAWTHGFDKGIPWPYAILPILLLKMLMLLLEKLICMVYFAMMVFKAINLWFWKAFIDG